MTVFTPTRIQDLKAGDLLDAHHERVARDPKPCKDHKGNLVFVVEGFDPITGEYNFIHSDVCCPADEIFVVRTTD